MLVSLYLGGKNHVSNGCNMYLLRSPAKPSAPSTTGMDPCRICHKKSSKAEVINESSSAKISMPPELQGAKPLIQPRGQFIHIYIYVYTYGGGSKKIRNSKMGCPGKWKHGPKPAVCPSCLILSHTHIHILHMSSDRFPPKEQGKIIKHISKRKKPKEGMAKNAFLEILSKRIPSRRFLGYPPEHDPPAGLFGVWRKEATDRLILPTQGPTATLLSEEVQKAQHPLGNPWWSKDDSSSPGAASQFPANV